MDDVQRLVNKIMQLPPERISQVVDYIEFLHWRETQNPEAQDTERQAAEKFADDPLFGMWRNREDMADVADYLSKMRGPPQARA